MHLSLGLFCNPTGLAAWLPNTAINGWVADQRQVTAYKK